MNKPQTVPFPKIIIYLTLFFSLAAVIMALMNLISNEKIVYVDSMKLLGQYKGTMIARKSYDEKVAMWKTNIDTLTIKLNKAIISYQRQSSSMSAKEKAVVGGAYPIQTKSIGKL